MSVILGYYLDATERWFASIRVWAMVGNVSKNLPDLTQNAKVNAPSTQPAAAPAS